MNYELAAILITVVCQGIYIAFRMGKFEEKLINIEKKQDKHNSIIERTFVLEEQMKNLLRDKENEHIRKWD